MAIFSQTITLGLKPLGLRSSAVNMKSNLRPIEGGKRGEEEQSPVEGDSFSHQRKAILGLVIGLVSPALVFGVYVASAAVASIIISPGMLIFVSSCALITGMAGVYLIYATKEDEQGEREWQTTFKLHKTHDQKLLRNLRNPNPKRAQNAKRVNWE